MDWTVLLVLILVSALSCSPLGPAQTRAANKKNMTDFATGLMIGKISRVITSSFIKAYLIYYLWPYRQIVCLNDLHCGDLSFKTCKFAGSCLKMCFCVGFKKKNYSLTQGLLRARRLFREGRSAIDRSCWSKWLNSAEIRKSGCIALWEDL